MAREEYEVIIDTGGIPFSPKIDNSVKTVIDMVYNTNPYILPRALKNEKTLDILFLRQRRDSR